VTSRFGTTKDIDIGDVRRCTVYKRIGEAQRLLILDGQGNLYDSVNLATPILSIVAMTDFSSVTMFNRAYITPHNSITGLPGEKVYVYEGSGTARPAAGIGPSASLVATNSAQVGHVELGTHVFGVAFETNTGFITKIGGFASLACVGGKKVDLSGIQIGDPDVVARFIFSTKIIANFQGDFENQTYYYVERIPDNVTTTRTVDFYDASLQDEASYLLEAADTIPAGVGIGEYRSKLIVWGEDANPAIVRVSQSGQPEVFNLVEGFITVKPGIGGGVRNAFEHRNQLVMLKAQHAFTSIDNGEPAAFWEVGSVDMSVGTECHGVGRSLDFGENVKDLVFVADRGGLKVYNGTFTVDDLTFNVDDIWSRITKTAFNQVELVIDPIESRIYVAIPLDGATRPTHVLYADCSEGLDHDSIRWDLWAFPTKPTSIVVDVVQNKTVFKYGSIDGGVYMIDEGSKLDDGQAIDHWIEFPHLPSSEELVDQTYHYTGARMRIRGVGNLIITLRGLDEVDNLVPQSPLLQELPGKTLFQGWNFTSERCSCKLRLNVANNWFILTKITFFVSLVWEDRG
jgi:hypothetical protein